jgi:hypothetical protein
MFALLLPSRSAISSCEQLGYCAIGKVGIAKKYNENAHHY